MPGYNHYASCSCGWCVASGRSGAGAPSRAEVSQLPTFQSITTPNARCPKCGASVFFYAAPAGGRVYFDELGPPWPKHPCMESASTRGAGHQQMSRARAAQPRWLVEGWTALRALRFTNGIRELGRDISDWWVLEAWTIKSWQTVTVLLSATPPIHKNATVFLDRWGEDGRAVLSWLPDDGGEPQTSMAWRPEFFRELSIVTAEKLTALPEAQRALEGLETVLRMIPKFASDSVSAALGALSLDALILDVRSDGWQLDADSARWVEEAVGAWLEANGHATPHWMRLVMSTVRALY